MARRGTRRYTANLALLALAAGIAGLLVATLGLACRVAETYTRPIRQAPATTPAAVGLAYEALSLDTEDGLRLAAWYVPPVAPTPPGARKPALVLVHGLGSHRGGLLPLARDLARRGYGLLLFDLRAHGESEGQASTLGLLEVRDVRAAVRFLQARPDVDPTRLGIYGQSLGAAVAIMAAADLPALKAVAADSGFASVEWLVRHQFQAFSRLPAGLGPLVVALGGWQAGVDPAQVAPVERIGRISPRPVLLIHGALDETFSVENARLLKQAAGEPSDLWILPGVGHAGAYGADPTAYMDRLARFFGAALRPVGS